MKLLITTIALSLLLGAPVFAMQSQDQDKDRHRTVIVNKTTGRSNPAIESGKNKIATAHSSKIRIVRIANMHNGKSGTAFARAVARQSQSRAITEQ